MEVRCDKCQARYRIDDARVGPHGLTMRCGKCSNTFKVTRDAVQAAAPPAAPAKVAPPAPGAPVPSTAKPAAATAAAAAPPPPAPPAAANPAPPPPAAAKPVVPAPPAAKGGAQATMMFSAPAAGVSTPKSTVAAAPPVPPKSTVAAAPPVPPKPAAAAKPAGPAGTSTAPGAAPLADEAAGRTMMFSAAAAMKTTPPKSAIPAAKPMTKPIDDAGATMLFGAAPVLPQKPAQPPAPKPPAKEDAVGTTMLFGQAPSAASPSKPAAAAPPPAAAQPTGTAGQPFDLDAAAPEAEEHPEPSQARPGEQLEGDVVEEGAITGESEAPEEDSPGRAGPPRSVVIAVAAALGALVVLAGGLVAYKKLAQRGPPPAALEALAQAQAAADKDTIASLTEAETQANAAIQAAPKGRFPQAYAALAEVEVAWSDALNDQAYFLGEKALREPDEKKKAEAEAKASALQDQAKARLKSAFDAAVVGNKMERSSPDIALALADYYRAARSRSNLNRELRRAGTLKAEEARIAFVQGADLLQQDEGAKAVEKLKAALDAAPQSARVRFRLAMAYLTLRQDADATKELQQTLKLSPQHERAKMAMEAIAVASAAGEGK